MAIISAKYGFLTPAECREKVIKPYDLKMTPKIVKEMRQNKEMELKIVRTLEKYNEIYFVAGETYRKLIEPFWRKGCKTLMRVGGIGETLQYLNRCLRERGFPLWG